MSFQRWWLMSWFDPPRDYQQVKIMVVGVVGGLVEEEPENEV